MSFPYLNFIWKAYIEYKFGGYDTLLKKLGKYKTGKSWLYINNLKDINMEILKELVNESVNYMKKEYP